MGNHTKMVVKRIGSCGQNLTKDLASKIGNIYLIKLCEKCVCEVIISAKTYPHADVKHSFYL